MAKSKMSTPMELSAAGIEALVDALGAVNAIRFIRLFDNGHGDYTEERHDIFDSMSVDDIMLELGQAAV